jgi:hypothetical protein
VLLRDAFAASGCARAALRSRPRAEPQRRLLEKVPIDVPGHWHTGRDAGDRRAELARAARDEGRSARASRIFYERAAT